MTMRSGSTIILGAVFAVVSTASFADGGIPGPSNDRELDAINRISASILECSAGTSIYLNANIEGSLATVLDGFGTSGVLTLTMDNFLNLFPEADRLEALSIYSDCLARRFVNRGNSIQILALPLDKYLRFTEVDGKQRIKVEGEAVEREEIVFAVETKHDCNPVLVDYESNRTGVSVQLENVALEESSFILDAEISGSGELIGDPRGYLMQGSDELFLKVSSLSRKGGPFSFQIGLYCQ